MKLFSLFLFAALLPSFAQTVEWDTTGNRLLQGTFNFRNILWIADQQATNNLTEAASQYGTITFDGNGNYSVNFSEWSSKTNSAQTFNSSGTYAISASGFGFIDRPSADGGDVYGSVSNGIFIGSSTESGYNNLFIAALRPAISPIVSTFNQNYTVTYTNLATPNMSQIRDAMFRLAPNGVGGISDVSVTGYIGANLDPTDQTIPGASYSFAGGIGTLNLGSSGSLISGSKQFFLTADGQFFFGGSTNGWDMLVGIRTPSNVPSSAYNGLYYQAGVDIKTSSLPQSAILGSYFGAFNALSSLRQLIGHERVQAAPDAAYDYTYSDGFSLAANGSSDDFLGFQNFLSTDGTIRIGWGRGDYLGINVAVRAPSFSGQGVYINPTGVVNAGSFTPFTTGLAPGELITIFGSGFATSDFVDATFPLTLGGVTVRINGRTAPVYVVSPTQISAIVPYETQTGVAEIVVSRNGASSNRVTAFVNRTAPGVFAVPPTGLGYAAALHPDFSLVTPQNPARADEVIAVYLTGLGAVDPSVANGAAGPVNPLARATANLDVRIGGAAANIEYAGLAPLLRGLYQLNIRIPSGLGTGDQYLDIGGPDALNSQILLPIVGSGTRAASEKPSRGRPQPNQTSLSTRSKSDPEGSVESPSRSR